MIELLKGIDAFSPVLLILLGVSVVIKVANWFIGSLKAAWQTGMEEEGPYVQ